MERASWVEALPLLISAHADYTALQQRGSSIELQDLFAQRCEELWPSVRYCRFKSTGHAEAQNEADEEADEIQRQDAEANDISNVYVCMWGSRAISVRDEKLKALLAAVQEASDELTAFVTAKAAAAVEDTAKAGSRGVIQASVADTRALDKRYMKVLGAVDDALRDVSTGLSAAAGTRIYNAVLYVRM
jgi:hypothetical protein